MSKVGSIKGEASSNNNKPGTIIDDCEDNSSGDEGTRLTPAPMAKVALPIEEKRIAAPTKVTEAQTRALSLSVSLVTPSVARPTTGQRQLPA